MRSEGASDEATRAPASFTAWAIATCASAACAFVVGALGGCSPRAEPIRPTLGSAPKGAADARAPERDPGRAPSTALRVLEIGRSRIRVWLARGDGARVGHPLPAGHEAALLSWIERCARAVAGFYGEFPVRDLELRIRSTSGGGIRGGQTLPTSPPTIRISVGLSTPERAYERNWSMTHEMVHLAFPNVPPAHHWIEEGLATYVEPIARARVGWIAEHAVWAEWIDNMPRGLPAPGDGGLDGTRSWGRTYWGGALFCLLSDVEIRRRTQNRYGLGDALRAIVAAGASVSERWPLERALAVGDRATGTSVLDETYRKLKDQPLSVDLDALWKRLGVERSADGVRFDDMAPDAALRRGIVNPPASEGAITPTLP